MNDSYSATRIHVMRTKIIQKADYERLLKMSDNEIIHYLQNTDYKDDVESVLPNSTDEIETVDKILRSNNVRVYAKLKKISSKNFAFALKRLLAENDRWNLQIIAEAISGGDDVKISLEMYKRLGTFDPEKFTEAKSIKELSTMAKRILSFKKIPETLQEFNDSLDIGNSFEGMKTGEILTDERNILTVLRCKRQNVAKDRIIRRLEPGGKISRGLLRKAIDAPDLKSTLELLKSTHFKKTISQTLENWDKDHLSKFEDSIHKETLEKMRLRTRSRPLGVDVMLNYISEKELEHSNLRLILKGKKLGLDESFMREHLVV